MGDKFDDFLKDLERLPQPEEEAAVADTEPPPAPTNDPYAHLVGNPGPMVGPSDFDRFLASVTEGAAEMPVEEKSFEAHDWEAVRETVFEDDVDVWGCKRCFRRVNVKRDETLSQCLERHHVNPDCSMQVAAEVMDT